MKIATPIIALFLGVPGLALAQSEIRIPTDAELQRMERGGIANHDGKDSALVGECGASAVVLRGHPGARSSRRNVIPSHLRGRVGGQASSL
jgi:hypothetical protein